jgi:hypothetical protein
MKSETELRELLADLVLYRQTVSSTPFVAGLSTALSWVLGVPAECTNPDCKEDHDKVRDEGHAIIRKWAAKIREQRASRERAHLQ